MTALILDYIVEGAKKVGVEVVETNHSLEDNYRIIQTWKNFDDVEHHKRYRIFTKKVVVDDAINTSSNSKSTLKKPSRVAKSKKSNVNSKVKKTIKTKK